MPNTDMIVWTGISGIIALLIAACCFLLKYGLDGVNARLDKLTEAIDKYNIETVGLKADFREFKAQVVERFRAVEERCEFIRTNGFHGHIRESDIRDKDNQ